MTYCNDCGRWVADDDPVQGMIDRDGNCWRCSDTLDQSDWGDYVEQV